MAALVSLALVLPGECEATKTGDVYAGAGNWDIFNPTVIEGEDETLYGNIHINAGGSLTFGNGTLDFDVSHPTAVITIEGPLSFTNAVVRHDYGEIDWVVNYGTEIILSEVSNTLGHRITFAEAFNYKITSSTFDMTTLKFTGNGWASTMVVNNNEFSCLSDCYSDYIIWAEDIDIQSTLKITNNVFESYISLSSAALYGVYITNPETDDDNYIWVDNNTFSNVPTGVRMDLGFVRSLQNNTFSGTKHYGVYARGSAEGSVTKIVNNTFENIIYEIGEPTGTARDALYIAMNLGYGALFLEDNIFDGVENTAIEIERGSATTNALTVSIKNTTTSAVNKAIVFDDGITSDPHTFLIDNCTLSAVTKIFDWEDESENEVGHIDFYNCNVDRDDIDLNGVSGRTFDIYHYVNITVLDAFYTPLSDIRLAIFNADLIAQSDGYTDDNGQISSYLWLKVGEGDGSESKTYNPFHFKFYPVGWEVYTYDYTITASRNITRILNNVTWSQDLTIQMIDSYSDDPIPFGRLKCYLNDDYIAFEQQVIYDESYINVSVYDKFDRLITFSNQSVNYSRTKEVILVYVNYIIITINQYDVETKEKGSWIQEWNLTLNGTDINYHFTGDSFAIPYVEAGNNNYSLSWEYNTTNNHTSGDETVRVQPKTLPPSTHADKNIGFQVANIGVTTTGNLSSNAIPEFGFFSLEWWSWLVGQPWFFVPLAVLGAIGLFFTWRRHIRDWTREWQMKKAARKRQRQKKQKQKKEQRWSLGG